MFCVLGPAHELHAANSSFMYFQAEACQRDLMDNPEHRKYRDRWMICIKKFQDVYRVDPDGPWAAAGLYSTGMLYHELSRRSGRASDRSEAADYFSRIVRRFPKSAYQPKARAMLAEYQPTGPPPKKTGKKAKTRDAGHYEVKRNIGKKANPVVPSPKPVPEPDVVAKNPPNGRITVTGLRFWSSSTYTRVVIDADGEAPFAYHLLKKDPKLHKPQRLFVDLSSARVGDSLDSVIPIQDDLLIRARAAQHDPKTVRVVVDIKSFQSYKVFPLKNPFRVVIDVRGDRREREGAMARTEPGPARPGQPVDPGSIIESLGLGVSRIVVDPGHGGHDGGAPGYFKGVQEKHIVLQIAKRLARKLNEKTGCEVILTRDTDRYLTLEERTAMANTKGADLFISIHTNAHRSKNAYGIETYFLNLATDEEAVAVAARENATSKKNISDLQAILNDLMHNMKISESQRLARYIQGDLVDGLKGKYSRIRDKGVKQAPFYVLLGAEMPAVLVETGFISNKHECTRLRQAEYQDRLVDGIVKGVSRYLEVIRKTRQPVTASRLSGTG